MQDGAAPDGEWHVSLVSADTFFAIGTLVCGLGAIGVGIAFAIKGAVMFGVLVSAGGTVFLSADAWVYYVRGVRHVYAGEDGSLRFVGRIAR